MGGSALSLFIIKEFGLEGGAVPTMNWMRHALTLEEQLIGQIPLILSWLRYVIYDYHNANLVYLQILEILAESQRPSTCEYYWNKESP